MNSMTTKRFARVIAMAALATSVSACGMNASQTAQRPASASGAASQGRVSAWVDRAQSAKRQGDVGAALVYWRKAAQAAPQDAALRVDLGYAYLAVGRHGAASAMFQDAIAMRGPNKAIEQGMAMAQNGLLAADSQRRMLAAAPQRLAGRGFADAETTAVSYTK
jgi:Flp pilus assembly protein TadD